MTYRLKIPSYVIDALNRNNEILPFPWNEQPKQFASYKNWKMIRDLLQKPMKNDEQFNEMFYFLSNQDVLFANKTDACEKAFSEEMKIGNERKIPIVTDSFRCFLRDFCTVEESKFIRLKLLPLMAHSSLSLPLSLEAMKKQITYYKWCFHAADSHDQSLSFLIENKLLRKVDIEDCEVTEDGKVISIPKLPLLRQFPIQFKCENENSPFFEKKDETIKANSRSSVCDSEELDFEQIFNEAQSSTTTSPASSSLIPPPNKSGLTDQSSVPVFATTSLQIPRKLGLHLLSFFFFSLYPGRESINTQKFPAFSTIQFMDGCMFQQCAIEKKENRFKRMKRVKQERSDREKGMTEEEIQKQRAEKAEEQKQLSYEEKMKRTVPLFKSFLISEEDFLGIRKRKSRVGRNSKKEKVEETKEQQEESDKKGIVDTVAEDSRVGADADNEAKVGECSSFDIFSQAENDATQLSELKDKNENKNETEANKEEAEKDDVSCSDSDYHESPHRVDVYDRRTKIHTNCSEVKATKLRCILNYFARCYHSACSSLSDDALEEEATSSSTPSSSSSSSSSPSSASLKPSMHLSPSLLSTAPIPFLNGSLRFSRRCLLNPYCWEASTVKLCPLAVHLTAKVEDFPSDCYKVDFANKFPGGGVLNAGAVQEEILFTIYPELLLSMLFCACMKPNEAILVEGAEKVAEYKGYSRTFRFKCAAEQTNERSPSEETIPTPFIVMDALHFGRHNVASDESEHNQFSKTAIDRELNKSFTGFSFVPRGNCVASGHWGCGAYNGDKVLKMLIQWMSASVCGVKEVKYCSMGENEFIENAKTIFQAIGSNTARIVDDKAVGNEKMNDISEQPSSSSTSASSAGCDLTVGQLYSILLDYSKHLLQQELKEDKKEELQKPGNTKNEEKDDIVEKKEEERQESKEEEKEKTNQKEKDEESEDENEHSANENEVEEEQEKCNNSQKNKKSKGKGEKRRFGPHPRFNQRGGKDLTTFLVNNILNQSSGTKDMN
ncbi:putative poly glycohydrolase [Monocercomonoides exilis]|uniref:putative poly glycohydrolase n=1 Tax=Monocercomonoides exilis TaxID=2049356 RepID=UPI003559F28B|nr:putative poly glycohydrolase [Monocercomonoides exilis]|eukprot:MONOS_633.1-p1 / transcript=MONOS_633.1 / gene=MONOS_633 / organism=Monocercomonoides_exilis_PA203 / gene_product=poly / transcript_product=poly / location=Mono_scaffold00010:116921-120752(-) / protein_length=1005 / sequence_SO=supercontig / SO=protein_coding / is_pseudo=false